MCASEISCVFLDKIKIFLFQSKQNMTFDKCIFAALESNLTQNKNS